MKYELIQERNKQLSLLLQVLTNRGIKLQDIPHYLNTTDDDIIEPATIDRIENGAKMLVKHIAQNDKVLI